ncbi:hypothetical protein PISL3812_01349 [Talaromyces islandicus]|uniref:Uncharacterized protein n=1 Tax=Talaromyces islandicus TaxID=28573 RepID=A0A0U1LLV9_TALIS|nr:hypothetical protein PISL3812_01349 [Talaromyces islandicus]
MLDENLPTFYMNPNGKSLSSNVLFTQHGSEPQPSYTLRRPDPAQAASQNRYAIALYDAYIPDVLFGEVLIVPEWTQPSLSAEAIRQNGGVAPPPEPIMPSEFTIHLYNPDQEIKVRYKPKTWNTQPSWEFEMPQQTFKQPSNSTLDRTQSDPAVSDLTPKLKFVWRKDGSLSKDFACYLSGKSTTPGAKKKNKEPDITIAIFKQLKEFTLYEPNLYRVEMEDFKGLEVVLMLGAVVIRDVFFTPMKDTFNVSNPSSLAANGRSNTPPRNNTAAVADLARPSRPQVTIPQRETRPVANVDPRGNRHPDAENARRRQQQAEEEARRTRKLVEAEQKAQRKKEAEINQETERLKRLYGKEDQQSRQQTSNQRSQTPGIVVSSANPAHHARYSHYTPPTHNPHQQRPGPYLQAPGKHRPSQSVSSLHPPPQPPRPQSTASFFGPGQKPQPAPQLKEKKSFFGFRKSSSDNDQNKLNKKRSSMF